MKIINITPSWYLISKMQPGQNNILITKTKSIPKEQQDDVDPQTDPDQENHRKTKSLNALIQPKSEQKIEKSDNAKYSAQQNSIFLSFGQQNPDSYHQYEQSGASNNKQSQFKHELKPENQFLMSDEEECSTQLIGCYEKNKFSFGANDDSDNQTVSKQMSNNKSSDEKAEEQEDRPRQSSLLTKINEPIVTGTCKVLQAKFWVDVPFRITSESFEVGNQKQRSTSDKKKDKLRKMIAFDSIIKIKIMALDPNNDKNPIQKRENIIKINYIKGKKLNVPFVKRQTCSQIFLAFKKSVKYGSIPLPYFVFTKIIARKLKNNGIISPTIWQPVKVAPSLLLKRELTSQQKKYQSEYEKQRKRQKIFDEKQQMEKKKNRSRSRAQTKKSPNKLTLTKESTPIDSLCIYGFILKQSKHLKQWEQRYIQIDRHGIHSYNDLKDWSSHGIVQQDKKPKQQTFTVFRSDNIQYIWTRFQTIDYTKFDTKIEYKNKMFHKNGHTQMLVIKLKHNSWKAHQVLLQQTELGIPITNFTMINPNNWIYYLYKLML